LQLLNLPFAHLAELLGQSLDHVYQVLQPTLSCLLLFPGVTTWYGFGDNAIGGGKRIVGHASTKS
jgi:hypothetical protein